MKIAANGFTEAALQGFDPDELVFDYVHPDRAYTPFKLDLRPGLEPFTPRFLWALKSVYKHQLGLGLRPNGLDMRLKGLNLLLTHRVFDEPVNELTVDYLIALSNTEGLKKSYLRELARGLEQAYKVVYLREELFDDQFNPTALLVLKGKQDNEASQVRSIATKSKPILEFASAMSRLESALVDEEITLGQWSYFAVQMATACRHESLLYCTVSDLFQSKDENDELQWYLTTYLAKTGAEKRQDKGQPHLLTKKVGERLNAHRLEVIYRLRSCFPGQEDQIALFAQMHWVDFYSSNGTLARGSGGMLTLELNKTFYQVFGRHASTTSLRRAYLNPVAKIIGRDMVGAHTMRHSLGTEAALEGHDAITVQAILGHSNPSIAKIYVDMAFHGLLDQFNELMEEQTESILGELRAQVQEVSHNDEWQPSQRIKVPILSEAKDVVTGACKSRICQGVPYQCYDCPEKAFVPFVESDHLAIAKALEAEINEIANLGFAAQKKELSNLQFWRLRILATYDACQQYRQDQNKKG